VIEWSRWAGTRSARASSRSPPGGRSPVRTCLQQHATTCLRGATNMYCTASETDMDTEPVPFWPFFPLASRLLSRPLDRCFVQHEKLGDGPLPSDSDSVDSSPNTKWLVNTTTSYKGKTRHHRAYIATQLSSLLSFMPLKSANLFRFSFYEVQRKTCYTTDCYGNKGRDPSFVEHRLSEIQHNRTSYKAKSKHHGAYIPPRFAGLPTLS
jgi:hypothetical protein